MAPHQADENRDTESVDHRHYRPGWLNTRRLDHVHRDPHYGDQVRLYLHYGDMGSAFETRPKRTRGSTASRICWRPPPA
jgi:hypothetical protein